MKISDIAGLPLEVSPYGAMGTPDEIDEMWYNAEHSYPKITIKPFTGKDEPPLRPMQRQHLPLGHPDRIPYEERMYMFFRNYRIDVERGRIAASNEAWHCANIHEQYYKALWDGYAEIFNGWTGYVRIELKPEARSAYCTYCFSNDTKKLKMAWKYLVQFKYRESDYVYLPYGDML